MLCSTLLHAWMRLAGSEFTCLPPCILFAMCILLLLPHDCPAIVAGDWNHVSDLIDVVGDWGTQQLRRCTGQVQLGLFWWGAGEVP